MLVDSLRTVSARAGVAWSDRAGSEVRCMNSLSMDVVFTDVPPPDGIPDQLLALEAKVIAQTDSMVSLEYACKSAIVHIPRRVFHKRDCDPYIGQTVRMLFQGWSDGETRYLYMCSVSLNPFDVDTEHKIR